MIKKQNFILDFQNQFEPVKRLKDRRAVMKFMNFVDSSSSGVDNKGETIGLLIDGRIFSRDLQQSSLE
jgi:hypothetical protein